MNPKPPRGEAHLAGACFVLETAALFSILTGMAGATGTVQWTVFAAVAVLFGAIASLFDGYTRYRMVILSDVFRLLSKLGNKPFPYARLWGSYLLLIALFAVIALAFHGAIELTFIATITVLETQKCLLAHQVMRQLGPAGAYERALRDSKEES